MYTLNDGTFDSIALELFRFQAIHNEIYRQYLTYRQIDPASISKVDQIPFFPISLFKKHRVKTGRWGEEFSFRSSGTTSNLQRSVHYIDDLEFYKSHSLRCFESCFGSPAAYHIFALLPSYLERSDSSLVVMVDHFIKKSNSPYSNFYLDDLDRLENEVQQAKTSGGRKILIWGVSFALLELAERGVADLSNCIVMDTGGMKGRRKEITKQELHAILHNKLKTREIWSEYGMTELLSQAYSRGDEPFRTPGFIKVLGREIGDPMNVGVTNVTCALNVIDLANAHSIAFIETEDVGNVYEDGSFMVMGRLDNSDLRGCNLMVE